MVKKIDFTIFLFVLSFLHLLVHLVDCSFVHLFVCSGRLVAWSIGRLFVEPRVREVVCSLARLVASSFGCFFVCSCVRVVDCSFGLLVVCSCVLLFDLFF